MKKNQKLIRQDLHKELIQFYKACIKFKSHSKIPRELEEIIDRHFTKVTKIISAYRFNDIELSSKKGRPENKEARDYFEKKITQFQYENKSLGFPKKENFLEELQEENFKRKQKGLSNIRLSDRSFDDYVREWKDGFFSLNK
jgi:hypothetical protein